MNLNYEEWLNERKKGIGGSDISAIMGYNKWKSPLMLYNEKLGIINPPDISNKDAVYFGIQLEDFVAKEFAKRTGKEVRPKNEMLVGEKEYFIANVDREVVGENAVLECKTTSAYNSGEWKDDEIPDAYILQVCWYIMVGGYEKGYIACLIGGQKFVWHEIKRSEVTELLEPVKKAAIDFWENHIVPKIPPQATAIDNKTLSEQELDNKEIILPLNVSELVLNLESVKGNIKILTEQKNAIEAQIKQYMRGHCKARTGQYQIHWNVSTYETFDTKRFKAEQPELVSQYMKQAKKDNGIRYKIIK